MSPTQKYRTGISGSSWSGEGPDVIEIGNAAEVFKLAAEQAETLFKGPSASVKDGDTVRVELDTDGDGTIQATIVVDLTPDASEYVCETCKGDPEEMIDCSDCHGSGIGGSTPDGDRFIDYVGDDRAPMLCIRRYYEPIDGEE